jgi:hypothetical protein
MEVENTTSALGLWQEQTSLSGYSGSGYLQFLGNTFTNGPATSPLEYSFKINQAGLYYLHMHCAKETHDGRTDVANDCYVRVEGDYNAGPGPHNSHGDNASRSLLQSDTKYFGGATDRWKWENGQNSSGGNGNLDPGGHANKRVAVYDFKAGETYTLVVSGRSKFFRINRFVFRHASTSSNVAQNLSTAESERETSGGGGASFVYDATTDFPDTTSGDIDYYVDNGNDALAIAANIVANRTGFARATRIFDGATGAYDVTITTMTEEDGESVYRLLINGVQVRTFTNPFVYDPPNSPLDLQPHTHTWPAISIANGATIAIESNADSNDLVSEAGDGNPPWAWARGRWQQIELTTSSSPINPPAGRIAYVADGNSPDPDDIGANAVVFGILGRSGLQDRLVHFSHSCDLNPFSNGGSQSINATNEQRRQDYLHQTAGEGIGFFGPFPNLIDYYNCRTDEIAAVNDLRDAINDSSASDPLWIIEAGEPDIIGYALQAANAAAIEHVHVVSHHPANDNSGDFFTWQEILDFGVTEHQIGDQNVGLQVLISSGLWDWAEGNSDSAIVWILNQLKYAEADGVVGFQNNKYDCSDAGMVYWWLTGANAGGNNVSTPVEIRAVLEFEPGSGGEASGVQLLAGWESWSEVSADTWDATVAMGVTAQASGTLESGGSWFNFNNGTVENGASDDGFFGDSGFVANPSVASATDGVTLSNGFDGHIDFTLDNTSGTETTLTGFHFDTGAFRPNAATDWELEILPGGDLTASSLATGTATVNAGPMQDDESVDLSVLADNVLDVGGTVTFRLNFTGGGGDAGSAASGHHVFLDNVGVSGFNTDSESGLLGDFDHDGDVDLADLDLFNGNIGAAATAELEPLDFDNDGFVGANDFAQHYGVLVETSNGQKGTFAGDLNLDGTVNVLGDAFVLIGNLSNPAASWSQGDINGDGMVDVLGDAFELIGNLGADNSEGASAPAASVVLGPISGLLLLISGVFHLVVRRLKELLLRQRRDHRTRRAELREIRPSKRRFVRDHFSNLSRASSQPTARYVTVCLALWLSLWSASSEAYEVWMGTHLMESTVASNLDDWALTASMLDGVNINRAPDDTNPASNNDWRTIISQFAGINNTLIPLPRSQVSRNTNLVDELAFDAIAAVLERQIELADSFNYQFDHVLIYNNAVGGESYQWTVAEVQHMRDWLDTNGLQGVNLIWTARNFGQSDRNWSTNPLIDHVMIEGSADDFLNNSNNKLTLLNWLWTNPNTVNKKVLLQIPRSENSMTQYASTRRVAVKLAQEIGYENGLQSDRLVFLPVTYNDNYAYLPETTLGRTSYTNSLTSLCLSLLEQRPLFEGRDGMATNADADSFVREITQPFDALVVGWDTWDNGSTSDASVTVGGVTGSAVTTSEGAAWNVSDGRGASADGDWGAFAGLPAASTLGGEGVQNENLELPNAATGGTITFTLANLGESDLELDGFHFDAYAFRPKAARSYVLSVLDGGGITSGVIYTSGDDEITSVGGAWNNDAHDDISHSLLELADHTLESGATASFLLSFSSGDGDGSGGHDLWIDNVAVTGTFGELLGDFDADGDVDLVDLDQYNGNIGAAATGSLEPLDFDNDGVVGVNDFTQHYETLVATSNGQKGTFAGDLNLDGTVNVLGDAFFLVENLGNTGASWAQGDVNGDGMVNVLGDAFLLIENLGNSNEPTGT